MEREDFEIEVVRKKLVDEFFWRINLFFVIDKNICEKCKLFLFKVWLCGSEGFLILEKKYLIIVYEIVFRG